MAEADRAAFLRAICENPADDVSRLVYADWLEEHGEQSLALFIRESVAAERSRPALIGFPTGRGPSFYRWPEGGWHWCHPDYAPPGAPTVTIPNPCPAARLFVSRGFVELVELPAAAYRDFAGLLFAEQPITHVSITDKFPHQRPNRPTYPLYDWRLGAGSAGLPLDLYHRLPAKSFESSDAALAALSQTCVNYGRALVGLPPLYPAP